MPPFPIFPLGNVVFPGQDLPLHIFEARYRQLVREVLQNDGEFGIALVQQGEEVGGGAIPVDIGCTVRITEVEEMPDGRFNILCRGGRRFRVLQLLDESPYLRANVDFPPHPTDAAEPDTLSFAEEIAQLYQDHLRLSIAATGGWQRTFSCPNEPVPLTDLIGASLDIGPRAKQEILAAELAMERLQLSRNILRRLNLELAQQVTALRRAQLGNLEALN